MFIGWQSNRSAVKKTVAVKLLHYQKVKVSRIFGKFCSFNVFKKGCFVMTKSLRIFVLTVALMLAASVPALAYTQNFVLVNNTGSTVYNLYVSPVNSDNWEEDVLGDNVIMPGDSTTINFNGRSERYWDLRLVFDNGVDLYWENIDLFSISRITINSDGTANFR